MSYYTRHIIYRISDYIKSYNIYYNYIIWAIVVQMFKLYSFCPLDDQLIRIINTAKI